jgi:4-hydroxymandelate oxidase
VTAELVDRAVTAGYSAIVVTVDTPLLGRRERDLRNAFSLPPNILYENLEGSLAGAGTSDVGSSAIAQYFAALIDPALSWKDLEWLVGKAPVPILVKGIVRGDDARRAVSVGVKGVIVSNHGGRQLDYAIASLEALPEVVQEVGAQVPVFKDGGVRRGTDILKALALGAQSVFIGRPFLWALAVDGERGVRDLLEHLREELRTSMRLLGVSTLAQLTPDLLARA